MRIHRRAFDWDAETGVVPDGAEDEIILGLPANVGTRVTVSEPALLKLRSAWNIMQRAGRTLAVNKTKSE